jgi:hypothetical protein
LAKVSKRKRRPAQNGVQAIFSERDERKGRSRLIAGIASTGAGLGLLVWRTLAPPPFSSLLISVAILLTVQGAAFFVRSLAVRRDLRQDEGKRFTPYWVEDETEPSNSPANPVPIRRRNRGTRQENPPPFRIYKFLLVAVLAGFMLTTFVSFSADNMGSQHKDSGTGRSGSITTPTVRIITPSFNAFSNIPEGIVSTSQAYTGTTGTNSDDFIIIQIAYSAGSGGNLPNISSVTDTQSDIYARMASASPGIATNFWEQVWTGRASSTTISTTITVTPSWAGCQAPCVTSIIITMKIGRYRGVTGIGAATTIAPSTFSNSQSVSITVTQANSTLVELLSHGASNDCEIDAPQPDTGQNSRNCFTATTERTELFDRPITAAQTYTESYNWGRAEVQRGVYLELMGSRVPNSAPAALNG